MVSDQSLVDLWKSCIIVAVTIIYLFFKFFKCFLNWTFFPIVVRLSNRVTIYRHQIVNQKIKPQLIRPFSFKGQARMYPIMNFGILHLFFKSPFSRQLASRKVPRHTQSVFVAQVSCARPELDGWNCWLHGLADFALVRLTVLTLGVGGWGLLFNLLYRLLW